MPQKLFDLSTKYGARPARAHDAADERVHAHLHHLPGLVLHAVLRACAGGRAGGWGAAGRFRSREGCSKAFDAV